MKTYYEKWVNRELGYIGLGSFHTSLMETYKNAGSDNREKLEKAFPEYFLPEDKQPVSEPMVPSGNVYLSDEDRENLLCSAIEGGSNYWYYLHDTRMLKGHGDKNTPLVTRMWNAIKAGVAIPVYDVEAHEDPNDYTDEDKLGEITLESIRKGELIMFEKHFSHYADVKNENDDATTGDVWFQLAVLGDIVYG